MKNKVILERDGRLVILTNPPNIDVLVQQGALVNPDLKAVKKYPPHTWRISGGKVIADLSKLKEYYKDKGCIPCVKKLSFWTRLKAFFLSFIRL